MAFPRLGELLLPDSGCERFPRFNLSMAGPLWLAGSG